MKHSTETPTPALLSSDPGHDPIEDRLRQNIRATIEALFEEELAEFIGRCRYGRDDGAKKGYRHGRRDRQITGTFGTETVSVPRARIEDEDGKVSEWRSKALPRDNLGEKTRCNHDATRSAPNDCQRQWNRNDQYGGAEVVSGYRDRMALHRSPSL